jgi:hypothetical protein
MTSVDVEDPTGMTTYDTEDTADCSDTSGYASVLNESLNALLLLTMDGKAKSNLGLPPLQFHILAMLPFLTLSLTSY